MEIERFESLKDALEHLLSERKIAISHVLEKGEEIRPHKHEVDEWVVVYEGDCEILCGDEKVRISAGDGEIYVIHISAGTVHALKSNGVRYLVLRSVE